MTDKTNVAEENKKTKARQVILSVSGTVKGDDDDSIRLMTTGLLTGSRNHWKLRYNETAPDSVEPDHVTVSMDEDVVTMQREGATSASMVFKKGRRWESNYETPFGSFAMGVYPTRVHYSVENGTGEVNLAYQLDLQGHYAAMHELNIRFAPGKGRGKNKEN